MLKKIVAFTAIFGFLLYSSLSFAEEKQSIFKKLIDFKNKAFIKKDAVSAPKAEVKPAVPVSGGPASASKAMPPKKAYTKEEMVADVKETLDDEEELLNFIPGLKKATTEKGESLYTYEGMKLEELDQEKLRKIFTRVRQEATRIRTDRLNRQLETIRRTQQLTAVAAGGAPRVPVAPPAPPRILSTPNVPSAPPSIPRPPSPPPAPPRR